MKCDAKAFSKLYEQVYQDLYRYALCLMRDPHEAEDAVSAAVLSAYEHIHKLYSFRRRANDSRAVSVWRL